MTAIVAGQGLGLLNTSLGLLGGQGQLGVASQGRSGEKVVVNAATGNLVIQQQDEWLVGVGPDAHVTRTYNSLATSTDDDNGDNWRLGFSRKILGSNGASTVIRIAEDGHQQTFTKNSDGLGYTCKEGGGSFDTLKWDAANAAWVWSDDNSQNIEAYELLSSGVYRLKKVIDADGNSVQLTYQDPSGVKNQLITKIATWKVGDSVASESIDVIYDQTTNKTSNILSMTTNTVGNGTVKRVSYTYDGSNRLQQVRVDLTPNDSQDSSTTYVTEYGYIDSNSRNISSLKQGTLGAGGVIQTASTLTFDYESGRVKNVWETVNGTPQKQLSLDYSNLSSGQVTITDALGQSTLLNLDTTSGNTNRSGQITRITTPTVNGASQATDFTYDDNGNVTSVKDARGNTVVYRYDDNGNRIYERDGQGNVIERAFSASNKLLSETIYTGAYVDGLPPTLAQGGQTTRYIYDAKGHLRFVVSPEGRVTERQYNNLGQLVSTLQYSGASYSANGLSSTTRDFESSLGGVTVDAGSTSSIALGKDALNNGVLKVTSTQTATASMPYAWVAPKPLGTSWKADITASAITDTVLLIGLESGTWTQSSYRRIFLNLSNNTAYLNTYQGTVPRTQMLGSVSANKNYVLEIETQADGSAQLYFYEKGKERTSGFIGHGDLGNAQVNSTGQANLAIKTTSGPTAAVAGTPSVVTIDNLVNTVQPGESDLKAWAEGNIGSTSIKVRSTAQRTDYTYDTVRGELSKLTRYSQVNADGTGALDNTQTVTQYVYDQAGNLLKLIDSRSDEIVNRDTQWAKDQRRQLGIVYTSGTLTGQGKLAADLTATDKTTISQKASYTTSYVYDGLNRLTSQVEAQLDGNGRTITTVSAYDDKLRTTTVKKTATLNAQVTTVEGGAISVSTYDETGRVLSVSNTAVTGGIDMGTTSYTYDKLGRLVMVKTPGSQGNSAGNKTFYIYDAQGRKVGEVGPEGALTEYRYNKNNQVVRTIAYGKLLDASKLASLETNMVSTPLTIDTLIPAADIQNPDRSNWNVYDKAGRLVATLNACDSYSGDSTEATSQTIYTYDGAGRLMSKRAYQIQVTDANVLVAVSAYTGELTLTGNSLYYGTARIAVTASGGDAITRYYYSADGLRIGELNAENYYTAYSYDTAGRLISTQRYANAVASVPADNTPPTVTSSSGVSFDGEDQKTKYFYDAKGQLVAMVDAARYLTTYEYDTAGNRIKEVRFLAPVASNFAGSPIPAIDLAKDHVTTYTYDANNRLTKTESQPSGLTMTNTYDSVGNLVNSSTVIKAQNQPDQVRQQQRRYDSLGRVTAEMGTLGARALAALPSTATQADKDNVWKTYATQYVYDQSGQRVAMIEPNGISASGYQTVYYYDKAGHLTYSINALGEIKQYKYNAFGQRTEDRSVKARLDDVSTLLGGSDAPTDLAFKSKPSNTADTIFATTYTRAGQVASTLQRTSTTAFVDGHAYMYDGQGNLIEESRSNNAGASWNSYEYNRLGQRTATTRYGDGPVDANNQPTIISTATSQTVYDAFGRVHYTVDERGMRTERFYDTRGRVTTAFEPYYFDASNTNLNPKVANGTLYRTYTYDAFDRVLQSTEPDGTYTTYLYDDVNRQITITTMEGSVTVQTLDSAGQLVSVKDPKGYITKYAYDADGRLQSTKLYETDGSTLITDSSTVYDNMGRVLSTKDGRGTVTSLKYDKANRLITRTVDDGGLSLKTSYHYDTQSLWTQDANGVWTKTVYDRKGRVSSITVDPTQIPQAGTADDVTGDKLERALVANPTGGLAITTTYTYDNANQVVTQTQGAGSASAVTTTYVYDSLGRRKSETVGPTTAAKPITTSYQYDDQDRVVKKTDAEQHVTYYFYDAAGRQRFVVDGNGALTKYTYDLNGRLSQTCRYGVTVSGVEGKTAAQMEALATANASPSIDQVTTNVYSQDGRLQYVRDAAGGLTKYQYDKSGNVIQVTRFATLCAAPTVAAADGQQKAFAITEPASVPTQDQVTRNIYDGANRRTWTLTSDYTTQAKVYATRYLYDANGNVIESRKYANLVQTRSPAAALASGEVAITGTGAALNDLYILADDSADQRTRTLYDKANRATFVIDGEDYVTRNDYDNLGHLKSSTRFAGKLGGTFTAGQAPDIFPAGTTSYGPSSSWIVQASNTALDQDRIVSYDYDNAGRQTTEKTTDRTGTTLRATKKVYDAAGHVTDAIDAYGTGQDVTTHYNYDTAGRLIEEIKGQGTSAQATTRYGLDNLGQRTSIIDPRGVELAESDSDWAKSTRQDLVTAGKLDSSYLNSYTTFSDTQKATLKALYTTEQRFDAQGHVTYVKDALGGTTCTDYDAFGNAIRIKDPNGNYGYFVFNQNNQSSWAIDPLGYATKTDYDALGQVTTITKYGNAVQNKDAVWSDANKITKAPTFYPDQAAYTAANGSTAPTFAYLIGSPDVLSGQTLVSAGKDAITKIEHDLLGRQTKITDAENNPESMKYDALGNKTSYTNKLNGEYKYTYDRVGNLKQETLPETVKQYDANGGVTSNGNLVINQYSYDARGNRTKAIEALGLQEERTTTYTYDALDRQVSKASQAMDVYTTNRSPLVSNTPSTLTISDGTVTKLVGTSDSWTNASFRSATGYAGGASVSFSVATSGQFFIGLSTKPNPTSYGDLDWCFFGSYGGADAYQKGGVGVAGTHFLYSSNDTLTVAYDGEKIRFLKNGTTEIYSQAFKTNQPLYMGGFLYNASLSLNKVEFGASTTVNGVSTNKVTPTENKRYDARGNVIEARAADGGRTLSYYDALNHKIAEVSSTGTLTTFTVDANGNVLSIRVYGDAVTLPDVIGSTPPNPINANNYRETYYKYDANGRQTNQIIKGITVYSREQGYLTQDLNTQSKMDANGNIVKTVDPRGNTTYSYYDKAGNKTMQVDAGLYVTKWEYTASGKIKCQTQYDTKLDVAALKTRTNADLNENTKQADIELATTIGPDTRITDYTYDKLNRVTSETRRGVAWAEIDSQTGAKTDRVGLSTTSFSYNGLGNVIAQTDPSGDVITMSYSKQGQLITVKTPAIVDLDGNSFRPTTDTEYNGLGLKYRQIDRGNVDGQESDDHITTFSYGKNGFLTKEARNLDASSNSDRQSIIEYKTDAAGRITLKTQLRSDALGNNYVDRVRYCYDAAGQQIQQISETAQANSSPQTWKTLQSLETQYNTYGQISAKGTNGGWQQTIEYDKAGRVWRTNTESENGAVSVYYYDQNGNATLEVNSASIDLRNANILADSSYAAISNLLTSNSNQVYLKLNKYDALNRRIAIEEPGMDPNQGTTGAPYTATTATVAQSTVSTPQSPFEIANVAASNIGALNLTATHQSDGYGLGHKHWYQASLTLPPTSPYGTGEFFVRFDFWTDRGIYGVERSSSTLYSFGPYVAGTTVSLLSEKLNNTDVRSQGCTITLFQRVATNSYVKVAATSTSNDQPNVRSYFGTPKLLTITNTTFTANTPAAKVLLSINGVTYTLSKLTGPTDGTPFVFSDTFAFDWVANGLAAGDYSYSYETQDANGIRLRSGSGKVTLGNTPTVSTNVGTAKPDIVKNYVNWVLTGSAPLTTSVTQSYAYNPFGEIVTKTNGLSKQTFYKYNSLGKLTKQIEPSVAAYVTNKDTGALEYTNTPPTTEYFYDRNGRSVGTLDANGNLNTNTVLAGSSPNELMITAEFHADKIIDQATRTGIKRNEYDVFGNLTRSVNENWNALDTASRAQYTTVYSYDKQGHLLSIVRPSDAQDGAVNQDSYQYDQKGNRISHTLAARYDFNSGQWVTGEKEITDYDGLGRIVSTTDAAGSKTNYAYEWSATIEGGGGWRKTTSNNVDTNTLIDDTDIFGRLRWHKDLGGHVFKYSYNAAGLLARQTSLSSDGLPANLNISSALYTTQDISFAYYANGLKKSVIDTAEKTWTEYRYDANGNRTFEGYSRNFGTTQAPIWEIYQYTQATYDDAGRLTRVFDPKSDITYRYDTAGNRINLHAIYSDGVSTTSKEQDYWYKYDAMNRFTVTMGIKDGNNKVTQSGATDGSYITYDRMGQRTSVTLGSTGTTVYYSYTKAGYLAQTGRTKDALTGKISDLINERAYDGRGNVYIMKQTSGTDVTTHKYSYTSNNRLSVDREYLGQNQVSTTTNNYVGTTSLLSSVVYSPSSGTSQTTQYDYDWWDSAKKRFITLTVGSAQPGKSELRYDANGHAQKYYDSASQISYYYSTDADGHMSRREEIAGMGSGPQQNNRVQAETGMQFQNYYFFNGRQIGDVSYMKSVDPGQRDYAQQMAVSPGRDDALRRPVSSADFDQSYIPIGPGFPGTAAATYTIQSSAQTLQSIAQEYWGDASLWYLIADANGFVKTPTLTPGQRLVIPNKVTNIHNSFSTTRPFDEVAALGILDPTLPPPPPPPDEDEGCGAAGMVLMVVVAIAVACVVGPAVLGMMGFGAGATVAGTITAGIAQGSVAMVGAGLTAAAAGAAAGSIASQAVGMATGNVQSFSWSQVGHSAVMGALSAGATAAANASGLYAVSDAGKALSGWGAYGQGALSSVITQQLARGLGLEHGKFSWTAVAASAAASGVGYKFDHADALGGALSKIGDGGIVASTASGIVSGWAGAMARHDKPNWVGIADDAMGHALGSALGDAVVGAIQRGDANKAPAKQESATPREVSLTREQEARIQSGATVSDIDPYGGGDETADSTRGVRRDGRDRLVLGGELVDPNEARLKSWQELKARAQAVISDHGAAGTPAAGVDQSATPLTDVQRQAFDLGGGPLSAEAAQRYLQAYGVNQMLGGEAPPMGGSVLGSAGPGVYSATTAFNLDSPGSFGQSLVSLNDAYQRVSYHNANELASERALSAIAAAEAENNPSKALAAAYEASQTRIENRANTRQGLSYGGVKLSEAVDQSAPPEFYENKYRNQLGSSATEYDVARKMAEGVAKSNPNVNKLVTFSKVAGPIGALYGLYDSASNIYSSTDKPYAVTKEAGGWIGGAYGASWGTAGGVAAAVALGSNPLGWGIMGAAFIGGVAGGAVGSVGGKYFAGATYQEISKWLCSPAPSNP